MTELASMFAAASMSEAQSVAPRWRRATLAGLGASGCATVIRRAATALDADATGCSRSHWMTMADMVRQQTTDPRSLQVTARLVFRIDSGEVWLEEQSHDEHAQ